MVDRQDIDALLIGALYGELTPADESRLAAHLESHPADRVALDNLTRARDVVRESREMDVEHEPPQAISALLLQEAARRAPKPAPVEEAKESWFERLSRAFFMRPAFAAAAMLVVVVGVAGTMYLTKGDSMVDTSEDRRAESAAADRAERSAANTANPTATPAVSRELDERTKNDETRSSAGGGAAAEPPKEAQKQYKDDYRVSLADHDDLGGAKQQGPAPTPAKPAAHAAKGGMARGDNVADLDRDPARRRVVEVKAPKAEPKPKELEKAKTEVATNDGARDEESVSGEVNRNVAPGRTPAPTTVPAAPPMQQQQQPPPPPAPTPRVQNAPAQAPADKKPTANDTIAQAKALHAELVQLVSDGKCSEAGGVANKIAALAPDYFAANVQSDRRLKACSPYLNDARNNANEQQNKSRAQKRPAPAADMKH